MNDSKTLCQYLDRVFKLRLPERLKAEVTEAFLKIDSADELKNLCYQLKTILNYKYGQHPYFDL